MSIRRVLAFFGAFLIPLGLWGSRKLRLASAPLEIRDAVALIPIAGALLILAYIFWTGGEEKGRDLLLILLIILGMSLILFGI